MWQKRKFDEDGNQAFSFSKAKAKFDANTDLDFDSDIHVDNENENENENDLKNRNRNFCIAKVANSGNSYVDVSPLEDQKHKHHY